MRMKIIKMDLAKKQQIINEMNATLKKKGIVAYIKEQSPSVLTFHNIRINPEIRGYNISPYTARRGTILGWKDWIEFNNTINDVLDKHGIWANVSSLGGKFVIREGKERKTEADWKNLAYENIGSQIRPVYRKDAWESEKEIMEEGGEVSTFEGIKKIKPKKPKGWHLEST